MVRTSTAVLVMISADHVLTAWLRPRTSHEADLIVVIIVEAGTRNVSCTLGLAPVLKSLEVHSAKETRVRHDQPAALCRHNAHSLT